MGESLKFYLPFMALMVVFGIISMYFNNKSNKAKKEKLLKESGTLVKVFLKAAHYGIASNNVSVFSVNGEAPATFMAGVSSGILCKPGKNILEVQYSSTRPGVIYKQVSKATDVVEVEVNVEANKEYILAYDKEKGFFIEEKTK